MAITGTLDLRNKRVLVLGLGRRGGGEAAVRYLASVKGARVTIADQASAGELADVLGRLADLPHLEFMLGRSQDDFDVAQWDLIVKNPAVPQNVPILVGARRLAVPIHTEASIFLEDFPGTVFGITGSKGKTSTAYFLHHLLGGNGERSDVLLAGNMGGSSLEDVTLATPKSMAVFELSSFQIETLGERHLTTPVACLTNLHEDHQDRYATREEYWQAKASLFLLQPPEAWRIHPAGGLPAGYMNKALARWYSVGRDLSTANASIWLEAGAVWASFEGQRRRLIECSAILIPDAHRLENVLCAIAAAMVGGVDPDDLRRRLRNLPIVPHRMERVPLPVATKQWINDTAATNPTAAAAGIRSRAAATSLTVVCGGSSKHLDRGPLVDALVETGAHVVLLAGKESIAIATELRAAGGACIGPLASMSDAVQAAAGSPGETVLLSPGCASFASDGFPGFADEFDRGGQFIESVLTWHGIEVAPEAAARLRTARRGSITEVLGT